MNISLQNVSNVSAVLTAQIEKADYQEKVEKALKTLRQRVNMPGFRKGMVPMGLIKKQYGVSVSILLFRNCILIIIHFNQISKER